VCALFCVRAHTLSCPAPQGVARQPWVPAGPRERIESCSWSRKSRVHAYTLTPTHPPTHPATPSPHTHAHTHTQPPTHTPIHTHTQVSPADPGYQLRPEHIESNFLLYAYTQDPAYVDNARRIQAIINQHNRAACGFASISNVTTGEGCVYACVDGHAYACYVHVCVCMCVCVCAFIFLCIFHSTVRPGGFCQLNK